MIKIAYIFPGQGAQYIGMGEDFYQEYTQSREVFKQADELLHFDLTQLIFKGPFEELTKTAYCQMAIFTVSIACLRAFETEFPDITPSFTAGLSLGEYTALVAAGALTFEQGLKLVNIRGQYMEKASQLNPGGMVSVIGMPFEEVEKIAQEAGAQIANLNCPGQVVVSGDSATLEKVKEKAHNQGAKKTISLHVGGAFHSSFMEPARQELVKALEQIEVRAPNVPVVSNVSATFGHSPQEIRENLARQVVSKTLWESSVRLMSSQGVKEFVEIGPGKVLKGLLRKIDPGLKVYNVENTKGLRMLKEELSS
ncbi:MAG: ACP S-malonyltransferase [Candidatus Omnitrophica bacterium]|nr:ACP S-malonyltransferase [Candidatus Omnitrophota bacterium]